MTTATTTPDLPRAERRGDEDLAPRRRGARARCFCGTVLIHPGDTRKLALKVPEDQRQYEVSDDLTRVDCRACRRNRAWGEASAAAAAPPARLPRSGPGSRGQQPGAGQAARNAGAGK